MPDDFAGRWRSTEKRISLPEAASCTAIAVSKLSEPQCSKRVSEASEVLRARNGMTLSTSRKDQCYGFSSLLCRVTRWLCPIALLEFPQYRARFSWTAFLTDGLELLEGPSKLAQFHNVFVYFGELFREEWG